MIIGFIFLFNLISHQLLACTVFYAAKGNMVLAGNNEDFLNAEAYIQFLPAEQGKHGRIYFGFYAEPGKIAPFGGVNDQDLFFDIASVDPIKLDKQPEGEIYKGNIIEKILEVKLNSLYTRNIATEGFVNWKNGELADKIKARQAKNISSQITDEYVGKYKITFYNTNDSLEVIKEDGRLFILGQDTLKVEILPE